MNVVLLLRLLTAHFTADFILQPNDWVKDKSEKKGKSKYLFYHGFIILALTFFAVPDLSLIWMVLVITISHILIDLAKSYLQYDTVIVFLVDQALHILVITIFWLIYTSKFPEVNLWIANLFNSSAIWLYILSYVLVTIPASIFIAKITLRWSDGLEDTAENSLKNAGKWIGTIERILILTFILLNQFGAIGFLLAAKSVFRFGELKDVKEQKKTEYILIGTLLSFSVAILVGICLFKFKKILNY